MTSRRRVWLLALGAAGVLGGGVAAVVGHGSSTPKTHTAPAVAGAPVAAPIITAPIAKPPAPVQAPVAKPVARPVAKAAPKAKPRALSAPRHTAKKPPVAVAKPVARSETPEQRGRRVLATLHYDWQALGYKIVFKPEKSGYLGFTDSATKTVTIWVRKRETDNVLAHTIAHELGHALDFSRGSDAKHAAYLSLRGMSPTTNWYGCNGCTDYRTPAGDWAEVFAYWLAGPGDYRSQMGPPPDAAHMKAISLLYKV